MFPSGPREPGSISNRAVSPNAPVLIRVLWACTWSFGQRRRVSRLWTSLDCHPALVALSNFRYRLRNPWMFRLRREVRSAVRSGRTVILA